MAEFEDLTQNLLEGTEENRDKPESGMSPGRDVNQIS